jgi:YidC/Oxa1 family membrane protein insertase
MDDQNKNLILATALSLVVLIGWFALFPPPAPPATDPNDEAVSTDETIIPRANESFIGSAPQAIIEGADAPRIEIRTDRVKGSISLQGGRINRLAFKDYRETLDEGADIVTLLSPYDGETGYYAVYGWRPGGEMTSEQVPGPNTLWTLETGNTLTPTSPVGLVWSNDIGVTFRRQIEIDANYLFSITQSAENNGTSAAVIQPYGTLARYGEPKDLMNFFILHEGVVEMVDGVLAEIDYSDMVDFKFNNKELTRAEVKDVNESGWIGFTDHFWMTTLIPSAGSAFKTVASYDERKDLYQTLAVLPKKIVAAGETVTVQTQLFVGAKEWDKIRGYEDQGILGFLDSIDWGWFFFLTKPIFAVLFWLNGLINNMGWSIIVLTLLIKAVLFPLAYKSYVSMAKMKELQPEMEKLKERAGDDRQKLQQEMMALYKKEKVNPASGCLPILLQIPIFFSLYKVIFVTLELRHAPWIGWIKDLSAPDPSSILNLFGILPYAVPELGIFSIISLGILPILLGISMWVQQKLNPAPTDPTQAMIFAWMPWVFMFMLGTFASGLVVYWIANNTITFTQQYLIMRSQGYKPDVFGNMLSGLKKNPKADKK